jgi:hypothetical protein
LRGSFWHAARVTAELLAPPAPALAGARCAALDHPHPVAPGTGRPSRRPVWLVVTRRYAIVGAVAVLIGALHIPHRPATLCPFRALTGLPCPFCGGTTAAVNLGHGDLGGAVRASPLAVGLFTLGPLLTALRPPRWWLVARNRWLVISTVLIASEIWQLARFGIIQL